MTSQSLTVPKGLPAVIQFQEVPLTSPTEEDAPKVSHGSTEEVGKIENEPIYTSRAVFEGLSLKRPRTGDGPGIIRTPQSRVRRRLSLGSIDGKVMEERNFAGRKRPIMQLPPFRGLVGTASLDKEQGVRTSESKQIPSAPDNAVSSTSVGARSHSLGSLASQPWPSPSHLDASTLSGSCGVVPLLTPPEDLDSFKWDTPGQTESSGNINTASTGEQDCAYGRRQGQIRPSSTSRPSEIQMPEPSNIASNTPNRSNWLSRACRQLVSGVGDSSNQQSIQMVVQALPSQGKATDVKPVFEKVVEVVQGQFTFPPYITITHAVSQVISMDKVPASPPATPNTNHPSDDYFQDQTIFTHAAVVPTYHGLSQPSNAVGPRPSNIIAAPSSIHITTLERYVPPATAQEVNDFFTLSRRSYLADRLLELSANNGTLLLVYPTKAGATTFANKYIGPVIEPFLRQFVLLNNLYTNVAIDLGRMAAVAGMKEFEEMKELLLAMCQALGQRAPSRGLQSRYDVVHAETAEVVLDRTVWKEWYLDQEQPRLRQNLVDYHKAGGRMPDQGGRLEVTPGMLARELVDGIRQSQQAAGNAGIEVGVFVIRRSAV